MLSWILAFQEETNPINEVLLQFLVFRVALDCAAKTANKVADIDLGEIQLGRIRRKHRGGGKHLGLPAVVD